jgi:prevent-host-death family protein
VYILFGGEEMTRTITLKELRPRLPKVIKDLDTKMDRFVVTKHGKPAAVMMSVEDYECIMETLDILSNAGMYKKIKKAQAEVSKGKVKSLLDIEKEMGLV